MKLRSRSQNHIGVKQSVWVHCGLKSLHNTKGICPPFGFDEGSHVATGSMFRFERSIESMYYEVDHVVNESRIFVRVSAGRHRLRDHKVQVSIASVTENNAVRIGMLDEHRLQFFNCRAKPFEREGDVLENRRFATSSHSRNSRVHALSKLPQIRLLLFVFSKLDLTKRFRSRFDFGSKGVQFGC